MYTPPAAVVLPTLATRAVSAAFFRSLAVTPSRPGPIFLDSSDRWTTTPPSPTSPAYSVSYETFVVLVAGGTPSASGEGWTNASGASYRLVAVQDISGARHGIAVAVGPTDPPILLTP